ncbi:hypothetical protein MPTK1_1g16370 [Marchantia polymorpha subsp. ruderalis]|uniref:Uncharacterized protein n=2 Tax=Marchantia polymorpha TaxID=3197 RepID=A0AAF6AQT1_MARPO|nr:hypothetical protein MARPO_0033s0023 [Marchantia polymorpha]BBM98801.1 hypothetical protein Mp_1g16370 [Marchantia polymorpha subsp. ruderalis]|eukprot:PTQ41602.1 hypothetical protein MARPO_0033s0023 [Marchantia polymorpha]
MVAIYDGRCLSSAVLTELLLTSDSPLLLSSTLWLIQVCLREFLHPVLRRGEIALYSQALLLGSFPFIIEISTLAASVSN